jgi:signal transduction histidine kinase
MRTLRGRLVLSHTIPILLVVPLVGFALAYLLETQVLLASVSDELVRQAVHTAKMAAAQPHIWSDNTEAQRFVSGWTVSLQSSVMLLDLDGNPLASSGLPEGGQLGVPLDPQSLSAALSGQDEVQVEIVRGYRAQVATVLVPVLGPDQQLMGIVHLSQQLSDLDRQFARLRYLIAGVLAVELLLGVAIGLVLALNLSRPLRKTSEAINGMANGRRWDTLIEEGPDEVRLLQRAFNSLVGRLRMLEESRRHLLANLVHELGRPLGAMQSGLQALLGGADQDPALRNELMEGMNTQLQRLRPLVDTLADLHGQVLGALELDYQTVDLEVWLRATIVPWRQAAHEKGLHWQAEIPGSLPTIEIDPDRMAQVLGNLLSNAIKYTPEGTISVEASADGAGITLAVADTGIGIASSEQARIFEPFYRSSREKRFPQGMGLGLSIARDLVAAHGGGLEVASEPGQGSRFSVWLPASRVASPPDPESQTRPHSHQEAPAP